MSFGKVDKVTRVSVDSFGSEEMRETAVTVA